MNARIQRRVLQIGVAVSFLAAAALAVVAVADDLEVTGAVAAVLGATSGLLGMIELRRRDAEEPHDG